LGDGFAFAAGVLVGVLAVGFGLAAGVFLGAGFAFVAGRGFLPVGLAGGLGWAFGASAAHTPTATPSAAQTGHTFARQLDLRLLNTRVALSQAT